MSPLFVLFFEMTGVCIRAARLALLFSGSVLLLFKKQAPGTRDGQRAVQCANQQI